MDMLEVTNALLPKIHALQADGYKLADLQVVLGEDTHKAIKDDPVLVMENNCPAPKNASPTILGVDFVVDTATPRLHTVRVKLRRSRVDV